MNRKNQVLEDLGDRLYYPVLRGRKAKKTYLRYGKRIELPAPAKPPKQLSTRQTVAALARKAPEVMVKISGSGKSKQQMREHLEYTSRNGDVELETESGEIITGRGGAKAIVDSWGDDDCGLGRAGQIPARRNQGWRRESFNIVLSMPPGTEREKVKDAARDFAAATFGGHRYAFAAHNDEDHPHVHLCVKAANQDGVRLNPRKADLQAWREQFAQELRKRGVDAVATKRVVRGRSRKADKQSVRHIERRTGSSKSKSGRVDAVIRESRAGQRKPRAGDVALSGVRQAIVEQYKRLESHFADGGSGDAKHVLAVRKILESMEPAKSRHQQALDRIDASQGGNKAEKTPGAGEVKDR